MVEKHCNAWRTTGKLGISCVFLQNQKNKVLSPCASSLRQVLSVSRCVPFESILRLQKNNSCGGVLSWLYFSSDWPVSNIVHVLKFQYNLWQWYTIQLLLQSYWLVFQPKNYKNIQHLCYLHFAWIVKFDFRLLNVESSLVENTFLCSKRNCWMKLQDS